MADYLIFAFVLYGLSRQWVDQMSGALRKFIPRATSAILGLF
jgi:hypothetical protein